MTASGVKIRPEEPADGAAVWAVNRAAFETQAEADLVDALRAQASPLISLVAEADSVVGHICFSPVTLSGHPDLALMGLAPMAVRPDFQRRGIGSALVTAGLARCRELRQRAVVVLGHPRFYPRFGFVPASRYGIFSEYRVADEVFMVLELEPGSLAGKSGTIRYHEVFAGF